MQVTVAPDATIGEEEGFFARAVELAERQVRLELSDSATLRRVLLGVPQCA